MLQDSFVETTLVSKGEQQREMGIETTVSLGGQSVTTHSQPRDVFLSVAACSVPFDNFCVGGVSTWRPANFLLVVADRLKL